MARYISAITNLSASRGSSDTHASTKTANPASIIAAVTSISAALEFDPASLSPMANILVRPEVQQQSRFLGACAGLSEVFLAFPGLGVNDIIQDNPPSQPQPSRRTCRFAAHHPRHERTRHSRGQTATRTRAHPKARICTNDFTRARSNPSGRVDVHGRIAGRQDEPKHTRERSQPMPSLARANPPACTSEPESRSEEIAERTQAPCPAGDRRRPAQLVSLNSSRPISIRRISLVPAPISYSLASRSSRPVG